jgi:predicted nucleic acid-binding protein
VKFSIDSNYLICLLQSWNPHHEATMADLERRLDEGQLLHLIPHTLLEAYSVMTRMPDPFRKPPQLVYRLLSENFRPFPLTPVPDAGDTWTLLADLGARGLSGGQTYDRWIAWTAQRAGMQELVTWNIKHFHPNDWTGLTIVLPSH